jgi:hypothetical protein
MDASLDSSKASTIPGGDERARLALPTISKLYAMREGVLHVFSAAR